MALLWRVSRRRAGRRVLLVCGGVSSLWLLAVVLLPTVLPPSHTAHDALPPAHRRIHQQRDVGNDYNGAKSGLRRVANNDTRQTDHTLRGLMPAMKKEEMSLQGEKGNTGEILQSERLLLRPYALPGSELSPPTIEMNSDSQNFIAGVVNRNIFTPLKSSAALNVALEGRLSIGGHPDVSAVENGSRDAVVILSTNEAGAAMIEDDRIDEVNAAEVNVLLPKANQKEESMDSDEGPYTLPILRTPKDGPPASPKLRQGYLARRGVRGDYGMSAPALQDVAGEVDTGEGSAQPVVPFYLVPKSSYRGAGTFSIPQIEFLQNQENLTADIRKDLESVVAAHEKAQIMAMAAVQHGHKLTQHQRELLDKLSPHKRKQLEIRTKEMRMKQERSYMNQLRLRGQIVSAEGGGKMVLSTAKVTVRFPTSLKKLQPEDWPPDYKIYLNITHRQWSDPSCESYLTRFAAPHSLQPGAIASFPSSGNTWIRYLMEGATGIFTGSMYDDSSLTRKGMYGEAVMYNSGLTLLQKTHGYTTGEMMKEEHSVRVKNNHFEDLGCRGLIIIRNPFRALISHRHLDIGGHTGYAPKSQFQGEGWNEFVLLKIRLWKEFYEDWLTQCPVENVFVTHYEVLKSDLKVELENILEFFGIRHNEKRLTCVQEHSDGLFKRKPSKNVPFNVDYYPRQLKDKIYEAIDHIDSILKSKGKRSLPLDQYEMYDPVEAKIAKDQLWSSENRVI